MPNQIEPVRRTEEVALAWAMRVKGTSKSEIARQLGRNRRTIDTYLEEAAALDKEFDPSTERQIVLEQHRHLVNKSIEMLDKLENNPQSLAGPGYIGRGQDGLKEITKLLDLYPEKELQEQPHTVVNIIQQFSNADWNAVYDPNVDLDEYYAFKVEKHRDEGIEDAEVIEDD
jgi:hypothetical protein